MCVCVCLCVMYHMCTDAQRSQDTALHLREGQAELEAHVNWTCSLSGAPDALSLQPFQQWAFRKEKKKKKKESFFSTVEEQGFKINVNKTTQGKSRRVPVTKNGQREL